MKTANYYVKKMSDQYLKVAVNEIIEWEKNGILNDGFLRRMVKKFVEEKIFDSMNITNLIAIQHVILSEASKRWVDIVKIKK